MWEIIGYLLLGILILLLALLIAPVYVRFTFDKEVRLRVRVWGIPIIRFSSADKPKDKPKPKTTADVKPKAEPKQSLWSTFSEHFKTDGVAATLAYIKELARLALGTVGRLIHTITVDRLQLSFYIAGEDAAQTAQTTGKVCAVLYPAVTAIQQTVLRIKKRAITVTPDYLAEDSRVQADVTVHVIPLRLIGVAIGLLFRYVIVTKRQKEVSQDGKQSTKSDGSVD